MFPAPVLPLRASVHSGPIIWTSRPLPKIPSTVTRETRFGTVSPFEGSAAVRLVSCPGPRPSPPFSTHRAVGAGKPCLLAITHTLSATPASAPLYAMRASAPRQAPSQHPGGGEAARRRHFPPTSEPAPSRPVLLVAIVESNLRGCIVVGYRRPRFVLLVALLFLPVGHTITNGVWTHHVLLVLFPAGTALRSGGIQTQSICGEMPLSAASAQALCAAHNFSSIVNPGSRTHTCAPYCVAGCSWRYQCTAKRGGPLLLCCEAPLPTAPPRDGGEGHLNSIVLGACHPTPALSDESEIIPRALHWTAGS